jgi:copper chaperone CopZ
MMKTEFLVVTGMTCGGCVNSLTRALKSINGVDGVQVELSTGDTQVQYDENFTTPDQLRSAVRNAGYGLVG